MLFHFLKNRFYSKVLFVFNIFFNFDFIIFWYVAFKTLANSYQLIFSSIIFTKDVCVKCKKVFKVQEVSNVALEVLVSKELYDTYQCIVRNYI